MASDFQPLVAIIMSCYNGEKYIEEQLLSIDNQTYKNLIVYIHDDGSSDNTNEIIRQFIENKQSLSSLRSPGYVILHDSGKLGYPQCFTRPLINCPEADYYAFCDQDDVWEPDKIERAVTALEQYRELNLARKNRHDVQQLPLLYTSAVEYTDEKLNHVRYSRFAKNAGDTAKYGLQQYLFDGGFLGMTYVFNEPVKKSLCLAFQVGIEGFKDMYISAYCSAVGKLIYDKTSGAKYRRHTAAVTNELNPSSIIERYFKKFKQLVLSNGDRYHQICSFIYDNYASEMSDENKKMIRLFSDYGNRLQKFLYPHKYRVKTMEDLFYRLMFLIGKV